MNFSIMIVRVVSLGLLLAAAGTVNAQQPYPSRPVRYIVPFPPGGSTDPMARMVAAKLTERWGQSVIVDNRPGGNTVIGTDSLAKATPDGYTIGWAGPSFFSTPSLIPKLPYDNLRDFVGVTTIARQRSLLVLHPSVPASNLQEVIALAKSRPGSPTSARRARTNVHLAGELFKIMTGTNILHIPYKGSGPLSTDLIAGRVEMSFQVPITVIPHINSGKLKPIAISGDTRLPPLPQVPTFSEAGLPGYGLTSVNAIIAPARTPRQVIGNIASEVAAMLARPDTLDFLAKQGAEPFISTPEQTSALIKVELASAKIIKGRLSTNHERGLIADPYWITAQYENIKNAAESLQESCRRSRRSPRDLPRSDSGRAPPS
jgi:tripartite-type tricarboxylate transporter receptor subunit TctC